MNFLADVWCPQYPYNSTEALTSLDKLVVDTNPNWISVSVMNFQWDINSTGPIYPLEGTSTDDALILITQLAHARNLKVMLRPGVDLDWHNKNNTGNWRGEIGKFFETPADWDAWFQSFSGFVVRYAALAQKAGVDMISVGFELNTAQAQADQFRALIAQVRRVYQGQVTYCANHDSEGDITWWDAVDLIGVDAYYVLNVNESRPAVSKLLEQWQPILKNLRQVSAKFGNKQVVFGEIGYCSAPFTHMAPWELNCGLKEVDLQEQFNCYLALFQAVQGQDWLAGLFIWGWLTDPTNGGPGDSAFSPNDKPASALLNAFWTG